MEDPHLDVKNNFKIVGQWKKRLRHASLELGKEEEEVVVKYTIRKCLKDVDKLNTL